MKARFEKRRLKRLMQLGRHDLVHAAGCTESNCPTKHWFYADYVLAKRDGVKFPRSLRHLLP